MAFTNIDCANVSNGIFFPGSGCSPVDGLPYARFTESWGIRYSSPDPTWAFSSTAPILLGYISSGTNFGPGNLLACGCISIGTTEFVTSNGNTGRILKMASNNNNIFTAETGTTNRYMIFESRRTGRTGSVRNAQISMGGDAADNGEINFMTAPSAADVSTRMVINSCGNVGVNTSSPASLLHLAGGGTGTRGALRISETGLTNFWELGRDNSISGDFTINSNATERMRIATTGNVGIGSNSPSGRLDVQRTGEQYSLGNSTYDPYTIAGTQMNVTSAGNGTACTAAFIHFGAYSSAGNSNVYLGAIASTCGNGPACFSIGRRTAVQGWAESLRIDTNGNVGINQSTPSYMLHVNGTFYAAGSSQDYKEGICKYDTDSCMFMKLKPVTYQYKEEFKHLGKELKSQTQIGLIAEEVAEVAPELAILVKENDNDVVRNVDYEKLTVVLLSEVQKLRKELDDLKTK